MDHTPNTDTTMPINPAAHVALLQLVSPSLPTGAFSYSQGLEWAIEQDWVHDSTSLATWLKESLHGPLAKVDLPILMRMAEAYHKRDSAALSHWCKTLLACRETFELREEEINRGKAMCSLLKGLDLLPEWVEPSLLEQSQLAGFVCATVSWQVDIETAATGYCWSWLENQVLAGIKTIPLGQTEGQRILMKLRTHIAPVVKSAIQIQDEQIGSSSPALAMASSLHETQYTRLYRS
ncbi:urease accessory protein UreF [Desulfogranum japonicum]|uniref:urease accessory protein UreF n=1 Tax=Desulfogranum japonicum TaxID=231447 RepID=UPI001969A465|nr:urease accessory protein UreF [Desulfogranum japonicum]